MLQTSSTYISDGAKGPDGGSSELVLLSCHVLHQAARENHRNIHMKITDLYPTSFLSYFFSPPTWHNIIFIILFPSSTWKCNQSAFVPYLKVHATCTCPPPQSACRQLTCWWRWWRRWRSWTCPWCPCTPGGAKWAVPQTEGPDIKNRTAWNRLNSPCKKVQSSGITPRLWQ